MKSKVKSLVIWGGWGISLVFIVWAVMKMDLAKVWASLQMADYRWIVPAAILNLLILYFRGARWRHFIWPVKKITRKSAFSALCIGFMANMVLPARIGEFVRA